MAQTNRQTEPLTSRLYDRPDPEDQVGENFELSYLLSGLSFWPNSKTMSEALVSANIWY